MPDPADNPTSGEMDQRMTDALRGLELVSHGAVQGWNKSGSGSGEPDDRIIISILQRNDYPHLTYRTAYTRAWGHETKLSILHRAELELASWRKRSTPASQSKTDTEIMLEDGEGHAPEIVAARFNVAASYVRRLRSRDARSTEDGRKLDAGPQTDNPMITAREMRERGVSTRQIAANLGVRQTQVMRWIRRDAA